MKRLLLVLPLLAIAAAPVAAPRLVLAGDGFTAGGKRAVFDRTTRAEAIAMVSAVLGKPLEVGDHGDCGQNFDTYYAKYKGDFELSFRHGKLSGWTQDSAAYATSKGIRVDMTLAQLRKAYTGIDTDPGDEANGGVGPSFQREGGPYGWLSGTRPSSRIAGLFAGATCLLGI